MTDDSTIRNWARNNGYQVGERGQLQKNMKEAYYQVFPNERPESPECGNCRRVAYHATWCPLYVSPIEAEIDLLESTVAPEASQTDDSTPNTPTIAPTPGSVEAAIRALVEASAPAVTLDETRVREIASDVVSDVLAPKVFNIHFPDRASVSIDESTHAAFEDCLDVLMAGDNLFMVGPPGTGKTTLSKQLATALGVERRFISCSPDMSTTRLAGYRDAHGNYVETGCRDAFETGKLFLLDEGDKGNPGVLAWTHTALENGECEFPDRIVERHENNYWCVAANTFGRGADMNFIGSNRMDAAFIDRFAFVELNIDEKLEEGLTLAQIPEDRALALRWLSQVREWRGNAERHNLSFLITPRASIKGAALLRRGKSFERVAEMRVWKGIDADTRATIEGR